MPRTPSVSPQPTCSPRGGIFLIFILLAFFMILYVSFAHRSEEGFVQSCQNKTRRSQGDQLLDPERMEIYQGVSIPQKYKPTRVDISDPLAPPVDGDEEGLRSMHMFSYNRCAPECCIESPYSCDRGCVCITPKQYKFLDKRGDNRMPNGCDFEGKM